MQSSFHWDHLFIFLQITYQTCIYGWLQIHLSQILIIHICIIINIYVNRECQSSVRMKNRLRLDLVAINSHCGWGACVALESCCLVLLNLKQRMHVSVKKCLYHSVVKISNTCISFHSYSLCCCKSCFI